MIILLKLTDLLNTWNLMINYNAPRSNLSPSLKSPSGIPCLVAAARTTTTSLSSNPPRTRLSSPVDLATLAKRLNSIAKTRREEKRVIRRTRRKITLSMEKTSTTNSSSEFSSGDGEFSSVWSMSSPCGSPARIGVAEQVTMAMTWREE
ncbi:hypothetical protein HN873_008472 [Arachis hypogaea]|uniref:Uncharacterized protein n=1 Tax=Arachis hypogaea TaxID=3818 RepID=A0A445DWG5_ARAHY|nr:hypothetical protein Ahy_A03g013929 isoform B [Arachis hypogaea]